MCSIAFLALSYTIPCVLQYKFSCTNALVIKMHFSIFTTRGVNPSTQHSSLLLKCYVINMMQCMTYIHAALQKLSISIELCAVPPLLCESRAPLLYAVWDTSCTPASQSGGKALHCSFFCAQPVLHRCLL